MKFKIVWYFLESLCLEIRNNESYLPYSSISHNFTLHMLLHCNDDKLLFTLELFLWPQTLHLVNLRLLRLILLCLYYQLFFYVLTWKHVSYSVNLGKSANIFDNGIKFLITLTLCNISWIWESSLDYSWIPLNTMVRNSIQFQHNAN